ncbi:VTT domain-containing protein [Pseudomonadota bacterium]
MSLDFLTPLFDWIAQNPTWAGIIVFLIAMGESLAIVGMFVPGAVLMVGCGALIATGSLSFWPTLWCAVAGAIVGDGLSYWLGHHYKEQLRTVWPFKRYPGMIDQGTRFLQKHGGKSVAFGRFVGPVRAIIPAVAGMMGMKPLRFFTANISSALAWAPAYLFPGIVFGASLGLAAEVASRLAILVIGTIVLLWVSLLALKRTYNFFAPRAQQIATDVIKWGRTHTHLGQLTSALLDPQQPETKGLAILATALTLSALLIFFLFQQFSAGSLMLRLDYSTYQMLQELRTPWGDHIMTTISQLGDTTMQVTLVTVLTLWLLLRKHWLAASHWLAAGIFAWVISWLLKQSLKIPRPTGADSGMYEGAMNFSFPSSHTVVATCLYGFMAILIAKELPQRWRWGSYAVALVAILSIAISRIYLGAHWLSDVLGGLLLGLIWVAIIGIAFRRHYAPPIPLSGLLGIPAALLLTFGSWYVITTHDENMQRYAQQHTVEQNTFAQWRYTDWQQLPSYRIDSRGLEMQPLNLQWSGELKTLEQHLEELGWQSPIPLSTKSALLWLKPKAELTELPRLPLSHNGRPPALVMTLPDQRLVLRLWTADLALENNKQVWNGYIAHEKLTAVSIINYPVVDTNFNTPIQQFKPFIATLNWEIKHRPEDALSGNWHREILLMWQDH